MPFRANQQQTLIIIATVTAALLQLPSFGAEELYGPPNLLKTMKTPFGSGPAESEEQPVSDMAPIGISTGSPLRRSLAQRLVPSSRLYLPGRLILGKSAEFTIKGKPGNWTAIAMADKNSGAKPIQGHNIKLGSDRKVVALGQIPENGVLSLYVETPIQGDMIGQSFYFEAAIWSKPDFSDVEIASVVASEVHGKDENGVLIAADSEHKKGIKIVPGSSISSPLMQSVAGSGSLGLNTGKP